ncbi:MAG: IS630 family transposase [Pirellulales bacterium]
MYKKYIVRLSDEERQVCQEVVKKLKGSSQKVRRAQILLQADADGPNWPDVRIAEAYHCRVQTIENLRKRLFTEGFETALNGKTRESPPTPPLLDGEKEAKLLALRLGKPPAGYGHWTLRLLADELVALEVVDSISHETVRQTLKNGMTKRKIEYWVIPPDASGEFVAHMEAVLETYEEAYDPAQPVLCMDEQPVQLLKETQASIPATPEHPQRVDYEYEWAGTASIFMFAEPLSGFRQATARPHRTKVDWAVEVAALLDTRYVTCERVTLVCDNLNTHTIGAFYEAFEPDRARQYVRRIDFCYTPKHGSWLNVAECELSCLTSRCLGDRRIGEVESLQTEIGVWSEKTNAKQRGVDWQFTIGDARRKLKRLYPKIKT